ncbi:GyrI-like domain-containing protein [Paenibacillus mendelii]|uniref:GyrI-like domain-containing protein n=1 Tax=Paenibacillus mendelii TaxID=206163 RepID=A0ABV6JLE1_9BACL|nr:GyrI-like domain-containing protein [Paenibacillus mendelii]MCQ6564055.1 GyrI-like domain-containing protein [Paenibacillus mendelii]
MGEHTITKLIVKSIRMIGIKRECLFKEFPTALLAARAELYDKYDSNGATELIFYVMTDEKLHPERQEVFYLGMESNGDDSIPEGMEYNQIENQSFVMTTHKGVITDIWKGYQKINEYMKKNEWIEDRTSYVVELYDERSNTNSSDSEVEIYIPVKTSK